MHKFIFTVVLGLLISFSAFAQYHSIEASAGTKGAVGLTYTSPIRIGIGVDANFSWKQGTRVTTRVHYQQNVYAEKVFIRAGVWYATTPYSAVYSSTYELGWVVGVVYNLPTTWPLAITATYISNPSVKQGIKTAQWGNTEVYFGLAYRF
jgi:hypothetical protein